MQMKEVSNELDPDGDGTPDENPDDTGHELYGKHVKYFFNDENAGSGYGRINRIENITDNWYYEITYANPTDPTDPTIESKVKKDLKGHLYSIIIIYKQVLAIVHFENQDINNRKKSIK